MFNYKQFPSIILQDVSNSECRFIFIGISAYGKQSDGCTFSAYILYLFFEHCESILPKPISL
jgi:hypothetical protein